MAMIIRQSKWVGRALVSAALVVVATSATLSSFADTLITNREQLAAITNNLAGTYALDAEIDLGGADWTPIGNV